jgi:hypothetical protein
MLARHSTRSHSRDNDIRASPGLGKGSTLMPDRDTVVVKDGGSSIGTILGIIAVILVLAGLWYFLLGPGANSKSGSNINIDVNLPSLAPAAS